MTEVAAKARYTGEDRVGVLEELLLGFGDLLGPGPARELLTHEVDRGRAHREGGGGREDR